MPPFLEPGTDPPRLEEAVPVLAALSALFALELLEPVLAPSKLVWLVVLVMLLLSVPLMRLLSDLFRPPWLLRELPCDSNSSPSVLVLLLFEEDLVAEAIMAAVLSLSLELPLC
jgi:hypothetical protein